MKRMALVFAVMTSVAVVMAKDIRTIVFTTTPQMHCESCENKIKKDLRFEKGVKRIETSVAEQTVKVAYDADKTTPEKIAAGFKKIGYDVRQLKDGEKVAKHEGEACTNM